MVKRYKQNDIKELVNILKNDGVICVPTDTVYGVCARISTKKAFNSRKIIIIWFININTRTELHK